VGIALRRPAVASYMRKLQYLRPCQQLSIENDAAPHVVGPHLRTLSYHGQPDAYYDYEFWRKLEIIEKSDEERC
jgi:hypothetical protein